MYILWRFNPEYVMKKYNRHVFYYAVFVWKFHSYNHPRSLFIVCTGPPLLFAKFVHLKLKGKTKASKLLHLNRGTYY